MQTAEGLAELVHGQVREDLGIGEAQGRRYSWGYPAVPDQSEHEKLDQLLDLSQIGMTLTDGFAPEPEQSTLAIVAHHPDATYFGMKSGKLPTNDRQRADDVIAGSDRDPTLLGNIPDEDPAQFDEDAGEAPVPT